jgi:hypothetical protein
MLVPLAAADLGVRNREHTLSPRRGRHARVRYNFWQALARAGTRTQRGERVVHRAKQSRACGLLYSLCMLGWSVPAHAQSASGLVHTGTHTRCELLGLGAMGTVPFNFPGADAAQTPRFRAMNPGIVEAVLPAGQNANIPAVLGGDMGAPFRHADGQLYFTFGDSWFESTNRKSHCRAGDGACEPKVTNDDLLASSAAGFVDDLGCITLDLPRDATSGDIAPITWGGPAYTGGLDLGPSVPGPGFSTGRYIFLLIGGPAPTCSAIRRDCAAVGGIEGDVCRPGPLGVDRCYFGACGDEDDSPCALRQPPTGLLVRSEGSDFKIPEVSTHIASEHTLDGYRGHFSTVSFYADVAYDTGEGAVWVMGRDSYWGTLGLTMSPYLMYHPVHEGRLEEPLFFAGMEGDRPLFSPDAASAEPVYRETKLLNQHSSLVYEPELDGGTWLLLYGGHGQVSLSAGLDWFVKPVVDDLFYDREAGVYLRSAKHPWGPWSAPITVFNPYRAGDGGYCENMYFEDLADKSSFHCAQDAVKHNLALNRAPGFGLAGEYGAAIVPGASRIDDGKLTLRWLLSTWNPYRVIVQESEFNVTATQ